MPAVDAYPGTQEKCQKQVEIEHGVGGNADIWSKT